MDTLQSANDLLLRVCVLMILNYSKWNESSIFTQFYNIMNIIYDAFYDSRLFLQAHTKAQIFAIMNAFDQNHYGFIKILPNINGEFNFNTPRAFYLLKYSVKNILIKLRIIPSSKISGKLQQKMFESLVKRRFSANLIFPLFLRYTIINLRGNAFKFKFILFFYKIQ